MILRRTFLALSTLLATLTPTSVEADSRVEYTLTVEFPGGAGSAPAIVSGLQRAITQFRDSHKNCTVLGEVEVELLNHKGECLGHGRYPTAEVFGRADYSCVGRLVESQKVEPNLVISLVVKFSAQR